MTAQKKDEPLLTHQMQQLCNTPPTVKSTDTDEGERFHVCWDVPEQKKFGGTYLRTRYLHPDGFWRFTTVKKTVHEEDEPVALMETEGEAYDLLNRYF